MEIYRNIQTPAFQILSSSWASRNGAVQMFFLTPTRNMFLAVLGEYIFYNVELVYAHKMSEVFQAKLYCKMCRGVANRGGIRGAMAPSLRFPNQIRSCSFSFKHQRYCFLWLFRNYTDQKFHDFYQVCSNFWTI